MTQTAFETAEPGKAASCIAENEAHVWLLDLDLHEALLCELAGLLTDADRRRAAAFAFPHLQARHVAAHGQMHRILAAYARRPAHALHLCRTPEGKPFLAPDGTPAFNLSHSGGLGLLAIARSAPIGADIEQIRYSPDLTGIAQSTFSSAESAALAQLPKGRRTEAFFACWTRKEAVAKFDGRGLGLDPASFTVPVDPDTPSGAARDIVTLNPATSVRVFDVSVPPGFRGAIAVLPTISKLRFFRLPA